MKALLLAALATVSASTVLDKPPVIKEWPVPWADTRPRDPYVDPTTGRIWFCGQAGHYLAYFVPETGEFKRYDLEPGAGLYRTARSERRQHQEVSHARSDGARSAHDGIR